MADLKHELADGRLTLTEALEDDRAQAIEIAALLTAQHRWGKQRAWRLLSALRISEHKRVGLLTSRQRRILVERAENRA